MSLTIIMSSEEIARRYTDLVNQERDKEYAENAKAMLVTVPVILPLPVESTKKWWNIFGIENDEYINKYYMHHLSVIDHHKSLNIQNDYFFRAEHHKARAEYFSILCKKMIERTGVKFEFTPQELHDLELLPKP